MNMGLAEMVDAPVLLVGDIDRGGVFAQLLGTLMLLTEEERNRVKGLILDPGIDMLEEKGRVPVAGVVPYMELSLEDEDSLTERFDRKGEGLIDIAVIRYPRISNFTDFNVFEQMNEVTVRYVTSPGELHHPDLIFLPGSKNTMSDLKWMRQNGLEAAIKKLSQDIPVFGICGGYQMLGIWIEDPDAVEEGGVLRGMELLPVKTILQKDKKRCQVSGVMNKLEGPLSVMTDSPYLGYEIHMGKTFATEDFQTDEFQEEAADVIMSGSNPNVYGSYVHGLFDKGQTATAVVRALASLKGIEVRDGMLEDYQTFKEKQYDKLAAVLREYLDMEEIYGMLREARLE